MSRTHERGASPGWIVAAILFALLAALVVYCFVCRREPGPGSVVTRQPRGNIDTLQSCPHYWSKLVDGPADTIAPLAGGHVDVPEYNDCQRLIDRGDSYGPLAVVFASLHQAGVRHATAATVLSIGGDFAQLGIKQGANCLYLWRSGPGWEAHMVPVTGHGKLCAEPFDPGKPSTPLAVHVTSPPRGIETPPVARFERDNHTGVSYVSVRCGRDWCAAGPMGAAGPPALAIASAPGLSAWLNGLPHIGSVSPATYDQLVSLARSPGWSDDQLLAPPGGGTAPTRIWAVVMPHPDLDDMIDTDYDGWQTAAYVYIPAPPSDAATAAALAGYATKLNLHVGWNAIAVCTGATCLPDGTSTGTCTASPDGDMWFARITFLGGPGPVTFCTGREPYYGGHVVGTARWHWMKDDETPWSRCVDGCCEVHKPL